MTTRVAAVISTALLACSSRTPSERERALERIPASAHVILAVDGPTLSSGPFRILADSLSPHVPASLACVVEAAQTSEALVAGTTLDNGATIVLVTRALVASCPALSRIADNVYVATIGAGELAADREHSMMAGDAWKRARPYLLNEPLAIAAELPSLRLIGVAQPDPLDAWVTLDAIDPDALGKRLQEQLAHWPVVLAAKLKVARKGTQIAIRSDGLAADDLVRIISDLLAVAEQPPAPATAGVPMQFKTASVAALLHELAAVHSVPVIEGGDVVGIQLVDRPAQLLRAGDVILGVESHRVVDGKQLDNLADKLGHRAALAVRRNHVDAVVELVEGTP